MSIKYSEILTDDQILSAGDDDIIVIAIVDGISSTGYTTKAIKKLNLIPDPLFTSLTTTGTTGASTLVAGVLNIPMYGGGIVNSVTGLNTDNADPANPIINIAVDGVTITGSGTSIDPLVSTSVGGSGTTNYITRWTPDGTTLGDSVIQDDGATIGIDTAPASFAKVWIASTDNSYGLYTGASSSATDTFGVYGACETSKAFDNVGIFGRARSSTTANYGVIGLAGSSSGVFGLSTGEYVGVYGIANNAVGVNHAAYLRADADTTQTNYGLFINVANAGAGDHYIGKFVDGNQALGKVLTSDALGNASWEDNNGDGIYGGPGTIPAALVATLTDNIELASNLAGEAAFTLSNTGLLGRSKIKISAGTESMSLYTTIAQGHIISSNDPNGLHIVSTTANATISTLAGTVIEGTAAGRIKTPLLEVFDDDAAAGVGGLALNELYQTSGAGAAPLNVAGIVMAKQ